MENPGVKSNSKVVIFDNHLVPIYYMRVNIYPNAASYDQGIGCVDNKNRRVS